MAKQIQKKQVTKKLKAEPRASSWSQMYQQAETFFERHTKWMCLMFFILSLGVSSIYYMQGHKGPLTSMYKWQNSDMAFFDSWAKHIAGGDWMCDTILHPYHEWHDIFAVDYFKAYPKEASVYFNKATNGGQTDTVAARYALINDIYKGKTFHQEPLYPYILAVTYRFLGTNQLWIYLWQFIMAACTSVLVYLIGRKYFGPWAGLIGGLFVTLCGTITVFEMVLLRTTLTNFLTVLLLYAYLLALEKPDWKRQVVFGMASGVALLAQSYFILFLIPAWAWLVWTNREKLVGAFKGVSVAIVSMLIIMSPLFIRNSKVGVPLTAMAGHGVMAYIPMNTTYALPMEDFRVHFPSMVKIRHDSQGKMIPAALQCLGTFATLKDFIRVYTEKINGLFMWRELPNNMSYYMYREFAPILKQIPVRYYFIAPLGLAGLLFGFYRYKSKFIPFTLMLIASIIPMVIAGNLARYRTPLVILMALAAALLFSEIVKMMLEKKWKNVSIWAIVVLFGFIYTGNIVDKKIFLINTNDLDSFYVLHYANQLVKLEQEGANEEYLKLTTEMMGNLPDYFFEATIGDKILAFNDADCCRYVARLINMHAGTLEVLNRQNESAYYRERIKVLEARADQFYATKN